MAFRNVQKTIDALLGDEEEYEPLSEAQFNELLERAQDAYFERLLRAAELMQKECDDCGHAGHFHGKEGCEFERGDHWVSYAAGECLEAGGPCGCRAIVFEVEDVNEAIT